MNKPQMIHGLKYDITFNQSKKVFNKPKPVDIPVTLNKLMYYKSTEHYFVFWTGSSYLKILRAKFVKAREV